MDVLTIVIITLVTSAVAGYAASKIASKVVRKRGEKIIKEAEAEGEMIKKERILQAKEKFIQLKSEHDRAVNERNQKIAQSEQRAKQIESNLLAQQEELSKKTKEVNAAREHLDAQLQGVERRKEELDRKIKEQNVRLEQIGGLSSEEAKNILIENMKAEAKTEAMTYVNEVMEEAKMTAGKEAKKIVVQTIQRVATEAAIENSVTVFNIDSDEVKGRIIGREGRNIRALEAATGIEIIVDDTPEAIILSGFDPVRREIARLALHQLVTDGRIHPARIEEVVAKVQKQIEEEIIEAAEILIKYSGYIKREQIIADKINRLENIRIKGKFDYNSIQSLSTEARQKLTRIDPDTIAQASRIPGISPSDINILLVLLGR